MNLEAELDFFGDSSEQPSQESVPGVEWRILEKYEQPQLDWPAGDQAPLFEEVA